MGYFISNTITFLQVYNNVFPPKKNVHNEKLPELTMSPTRNNFTVEY